MRTKQKQWSDRVFEKPFLSWFWNVNMLMCRLLWSRATRTVIFMLAWLFVSFEKLPRKKSVTARHRLSPSAMNVDWEEASSSLAAGAMGTITLVRGISRFCNDPTRASWSIDAAGMIAPEDYRRIRSAVLPELFLLFSRNMCWTSWQCRKGIGLQINSGKCIQSISREHLAP